jgi:hypothetical protein
VEGKDREGKSVKGKEKKKRKGKKKFASIFFYGCPTMRWLVDFLGAKFKTTVKKKRVSRSTATN